MRLFAAWLIGVPLAAVLFALLLGAVMTTAPGMFPILALIGVLVWAQPMQVMDFDTELAKLLEEAR